jgi:cytochrome c553
LQAFKSGERSSSQMQTVVHRMGDGEFAALAAYYSHLKP